MSRLLYIANARFPSEKANGYQMVQMCEAFAQVGEQVRLVIPRRVNTETALHGIDDVWAYYGVRRNFEIVRIPCLDLIWLVDSKITFLLQTLTFIIGLLIWLPFQSYERVFTRDHFVMAILSLVIPRHKLTYEVHNKFRSQRGQHLQAWLLRRVGKVVSLTGTMAKQLEGMGAKDVIVAHDGIRLERFENIPNLSQVRLGLNIPEGAFVACYAGRLHTMNMSKGLDVFIEAAAKVGNLVFLLVGGPAEQAESLRGQWVSRGLPEKDFVAVGSLPPTEVPRYLAAADVCLITSPPNEFFANETSPMKLFEYMAAGKAIIASDLPSTREVVRHRESAYLVPPSDVDALADALCLLRDDPALRKRLGEQAKQDVMAYTWLARAQHIRFYRE
jgi:glycosyltransferase involved in cell wall biosynthesis